MHKEIKLNSNYLIAGLLFLILSFLVFLPTTEQFNKAPSELSLGILLDLLITVPLIYYLLIRKKNIPKFSLVYVFIIGIILAHLIIPIEHQQLLMKIKYIAIPVLEIGILGMVIYKMASLRTSLKQTKESDFYDKLLIACQETFPKFVGRVLATEIAVVYYLFSRSGKKENNESSFTYFKKSGIKTVITVFLVVVFIETIVVHLLVGIWNVKVAWILSILGLYGILQVTAILRSMNKRPIVIDYEAKKLLLRYGFGCQTTIPFSSIKKIEKYHRQVKNDKQHIYLSLFDIIDRSNLTIHLHSEHILNKIYGIDKKYQSISLFVDEKDLFLEKIEKIVVDAV